MRENRQSGLGGGGRGNTRLLPTSRAAARRAISTSAFGFSLACREDFARWKRRASAPFGRGEPPRRWRSYGIVTAQAAGTRAVSQSRRRNRANRQPCTEAYPAAQISISASPAGIAFAAGLRRLGGRSQNLDRPRGCGVRRVPGRCRRVRARGWRRFSNRAIRCSARRRCGR